MAKIIMVQGTMSGVGKSLLVAGLCRIFKQDGYRVAPFKSQNMALNSYVTKEGLEMGRAQVMQAEAAGIEPSVLMNPVLLKPTSHVGSQVIVRGEVLGNMKAVDYFAYKKQLLPTILEAFHELEEQADIIVIEGAGSPAEINLRENDIVNMGLAEALDAPVLLAGDIDRGGVFAQLLGTLQLLEESERKRVKGLIVNKFRGDVTILKPGIQMLQDRAQTPVVGVVPFMQVDLEDEDSLTERFAGKEQGEICIAVIRYPMISNFTDLAVFERMEGVNVRYVTKPEALMGADMILLPGSKNTCEDLAWLRKTGLEKAIREAAGETILFGICGGYQMLGETIADPDRVEGGDEGRSGEVRGLGLLPVRTVMGQHKNRRQVQGRIGTLQGPLRELSGLPYVGYEIHMGETEPVEQPEVLETRGGVNFVVPKDTSNEQENAHVGANGACVGNVYGTYVHGVFDEGDLAVRLVEILAKRKGVTWHAAETEDYRTYKEKQYDLLADTLRQSLDMKAIYEMLGDSRKEWERRIKANWDAIAKPLDSMGKFEAAICRIGGIQGTENPRIDHKAMLVFCADNGVVAEGISQSGQEVTAAVAKGMGKNETSLGRMAEHLGVRVIPVDIGINSTEEYPGVLPKKVAMGTRNFAREEAMTEAEVQKAIEIGKSLVASCKAEGIQIVGTGEMGIGNTTTSSAVTAALLHCPAELVTGRGAGLDDARLRKKIQVIEQALERYRLYDADPLRVLQCVGGLDIAGMVGVFLGGAAYRMPVVIDGFISLTAAFVAARIEPAAVEYMIPSHGSREPACKLLMEALGLSPFIEGDMALGEGCGAVMLFPLLDLALEVYRQNRTFADIEIAPYRRFS